MAITRGVLSKGETSDVIVNIQEVTNDETPPAITGGDFTFPSGSCLEGDNYSVVAKTTAEASDRLGFSWSRVSGPAQLTIDAATGEVKTTTAFSRTSNWNNTTSGGNPAAEATFRATDTAGNSSDVTLTFPITHAGNLATWATGPSQDYEISYRIGSGGAADTTGSSILDPVYPNSELTGHFDQLQGVQYAAPSGSLSHLFPWNTLKIGDGTTGAKHHFVTSSSGRLLTALNSVNEAAGDWVAGSSGHSLAAGVTTRNHYYYEIQTIPGLSGYSGQFVDDNGQNEEFFRNADDITNSRVRVVHSSKASTVPISTGQPINMGASSTGPTPTVVFPGGFLCYESGSSITSQKYVGEIYYAINNGDGTISFATTKEQAYTGNPDVLFASGWGANLSQQYGLIRIRPAVIKENPDTYSISPDYTVAVSNYKNTGTFDFFGSGNGQVYYYDNGQTQTVLSLTITGGPSIGTRTLKSVYGSGTTGTTETFAGNNGTVNAGVPATYTLEVGPSWPGTNSTYTVLQLKDTRMGQASKTVDIDPITQMVDTGGYTITQNMASWTGGSIRTANITGGFTGTKTFSITNASANLVSANITKGTETTNSCQINVDSGFAGTGTFDLIVSDLLGNTETFSYTIQVSVPLTFPMTVTQSNSSPAQDYLYYGHLEGYPNGPNGANTGGTTPDPITSSGGTHLMPSTNTHVYENVFYQKRPPFGSSTPTGDHSLRDYQLSIAYNPNDNAMTGVVKGDLGTTVTVTDGTKTMTLNVSAATFQTNLGAYLGGVGGRSKYHRWYWQLPNTQDAIDLFTNISSRGGTPGTPNSGPNNGSNLGTYSVTITP